MTTYAEYSGETPFDWNAFLNKKTFTEEEWRDARVRAGHWVTCACGNQCITLPRTPRGEPEDKKLRDLGVQFEDAIDRCRIDSSKSTEEFKRSVRYARIVLRAIEKRSSELLAQQEVKQYY